MAEKQQDPFIVFELSCKRVLEFSSVDPQIKGLLMALMAETLRLAKAQANSSRPSIWLR